MKKTYTYSLLQYHHSMVLGEVLNIGLLIYFPYTNEIRFIYPKTLERIRNVYANFPEKTILSYYQYFKQRINQLNITPEIFYNYELGQSLKSFVESELLPEDSSMLQFSNYNKAILYSNNLESLVKNLAEIYFPLDTINTDINSIGLDHSKNKAVAKEEWIALDFKNKIVKIDKDFIFLPSKSDLLSF